MAKKKPSETSVAEPTFEDALKRLEEIVHQLEEGEIPLAEALGRYEEGVRLLRQSYDLLEHAERRIALLSGVDAEGKAISQPLEDRPTEPLTAKGSRRSQRRSAPPTTTGGSDPAHQTGKSDVDAPDGLF